MRLEFRDGLSDLDTLRALFTEYSDLLISENPDFSKYLEVQNFDNELESPGKKYSDGGGIYIAYVDGTVAGCVGFRKLDDDSAELKRMYLRPAFRGMHISPKMLEKCLCDASALGYKRMYLDTLRSLKSAIGLYRSYGFEEIGPYNSNPVEGDMLYFVKNLKGKESFRPLRRKAQELEKVEAVDILKRNSHGTLALSGDDGYPYSVPISYAYTSKGIVFHSALTGHKIESIRRCSKASFSVVDADLVIPSEYTTAYRSVIVFGRIEILEDKEKREALENLAEKYNPAASAESRDAYIDSYWNGVCAFRLSIEHISGKKGSSLLKKRTPKG